MYLNLYHGWCFTHNLSCHENGRIIVGWCPIAFDLLILQMTSQLIHCSVTPRHGEKFYCTFVYGFNDSHSREELWSGLKCIAGSCNEPWVLLGDFNALSCSEDRIGVPVRGHEIAPMRKCLHFCHLDDVRATGRHYTWCNKQEGVHRVLSIIDRVLANAEWLERYEQDEVAFLPEGEYDHTPILLCVYPDSNIKKPFGFIIYGVNILRCLKL